MAHQGNGSAACESAARRNLIRDIVDYAVESHEAGIVVDFEEVPDASQAHFRAFIGGLAPPSTPWD